MRNGFLSARVLIPAMCCVLATSGSAQARASLAGRVLTADAVPIPDATIHVVTANRLARSGADGRFVITDLAPGDHTVEVTTVGRERLQRQLTLKAATNEVEFRLGARAVTLEKVAVEGSALPGSMRPAAAILGNILTVGAKSEVIEVAHMDANLAEKTPRQIFSRVPGIFVYDMDGSGNQVNVSTRGLDAHRSWEMNVRQDGVLLNSDLYGYPASHYSPPMEAIQRIELIRGTAALQYGSQFGGLLNYVTREAGVDSRLELLTNSSVGSLGLVSSYAALGGRSGDVSYSAYAQIRRSDGYRYGSRSESGGQLLRLEWRASRSLDVRAQVGRSAYLYRLPGPLTDSMFRANPRAATRTRNWFSPDIVIPSLRAELRGSSRTRMVAQLSGVYGDRSSVQFVGFANVPDAINPATGERAPRQVDIDRFNSVTGEVRFTSEYALRAWTGLVAAGLALTNNDLHRRQLGTGTAGSDFDLSLVAGFRRDIHYRTRNLALYLENDFRVTPRWSVVPGMRVERGTTRMTGTLAYYDAADVARSVEHRFPLFGLRTTVRGRLAEWYGGWSQAYRPMILQDLLPASPIERTDRSIRDARGWTMEAGQRGRAGRITYDVSAFVMRYGNRYGAVTMSDSTGTFLFKTNVGNTATKGIELSLDVPLFVRDRVALRAFTATSYLDARYRAGTVAVSGQNRSVAGNRVEAVPRWITRNGFQAAVGSLSVTTQVSHTSGSYADALNTVTPNASGSVGFVPSYTVADLSGSFRLGRARLRAGVNNLFDEQYFTKRPTFYPGPGVWPSDGRTLQAGLEFDAVLIR